MILGSRQQSNPLHPSFLPWISCHCNLDTQWCWTFRWVCRKWIWLVIILVSLLKVWLWQTLSSCFCNWTSKMPSLSPRHCSATSHWMNVSRQSWSKYTNQVHSSSSLGFVTGWPTRPLWSTCKICTLPMVWLPDATQTSTLHFKDIRVQTCTASLRKPTWHACWNSGMLFSILTSNYLYQAPNSSFVCCYQSATYGKALQCLWFCMLCNRSPIWPIWVG